MGRNICIPLLAQGLGKGRKCSLKRSLPNNSLANNSKGTDLKVQITSADPVTQLLCQSSGIKGGTACTKLSLQDPRGQAGDCSEVTCWHSIEFLGKRGVTLTPKGSGSARFVQVLEGAGRGHLDGSALCILGNQVHVTVMDPCV